MESIVVSVLSGVVIALLAFIVFLEREHRKQTRLLIDAIMSKTPGDYLALKTAEQPFDEPEEPAMSPLSELSDEQFLNIINKNE